VLLLAEIRQGFATILSWLLPETWLRAVWMIMRARSTSGPRGFTVAIVLTGRDAVVMFHLAPTTEYLLSESELRHLLPASLAHEEIGGWVYSAL
jgi:hypothetical protein